MVWTAPSGHVFTTAEQVTAATLNTYVDANTSFLYGDTAWTAATLTNGWTNAGAGFASAAYRLQGTSVLLRGRIFGGTIGTTAFALPAGYRPPGHLLFAVASAGVYGSLQVDTAGQVKPVVGSATDISLNCQFDVLA